MSTDGFNFKLGRMKMNAERKAIFIQKHQEELDEMVKEMQLTCPHKEVETQEVRVYPDDQYNLTTRIRTTCILCKLTVER